MNGVVRVMVLPLGIAVAGVNTMVTALVVAVLPTLSASFKARAVPTVIAVPSAGKALPADGWSLLVETDTTRPFVVAA